MKTRNRGVGISNSDNDAESIIQTLASSFILQMETWPQDIYKYAFRYIKRIIDSDEILYTIINFKESSSINVSFPKNFNINNIWLYIPKKQRIAFGQFFTPLEIVNHILNVCQRFKSDFITGNGLVADISCGSGVFLQELIRRQLIHNVDPKKALQRTIGIDKDPMACAIAKLSLAFEICKTLYEQKHSLDGVEKWPLPRIYCIDSLGIGKEGIIDYSSSNSYPNSLLNRIDAIIGNFPFLEAKKMNRVDPNLKNILKRRFPELFGAFDLYVPFIYQSIRLLKEGGIFGVVLPNKFLVARYAKYLRKKILEENQLLQISDFSRVKDSFPKTSVYPIVLFFQKGKTSYPRNEVYTYAVDKLDQIESEKTHKLNLELFNLVGSNYTFFCRNHYFFKHLKKIFHSVNSIKLGEIVDLRTTVSFHKKGVREKFIKKLDEFSDVDKNQIHPYLGGRSYAKKNEVDSFLVDWQSYYIWYPPNIKELVGHNVAPLDIFLRPKIIFCQHSQRLRAYFDEKGTFVTKDVYPIAIPKDSNEGAKSSGWLLAAYFNSTLLSTLYNTIYHGITIGNNYYHYLPVFLKEIKFILPDEDNGKVIVDLAKKIQKLLNTNTEANRKKIGAIYSDLDLQISKINGLSEREHQIMIEHFKKEKIYQPWENLYSE